MLIDQVQSVLAVSFDTEMDQLESTIFHSPEQSVVYSVWPGLAAPGHTRILQVVTDLLNQSLVDAEVQVDEEQMLVSMCDCRVDVLLDCLEFLGSVRWWAVHAPKTHSASLRTPPRCLKQRTLGTEDFIVIIRCPDSIEGWSWKTVQWRLRLVPWFRSSLAEAKDGMFWLSDDEFPTTGSLLHL